MRHTPPRTIRRVPARLLARVLAVCLALAASTTADVYEVGQGRLDTVGDVPWERLAAGDSVRIHWRPEPYRDKWVVCVRGTADRPVVIAGVPGPDGQLPVVDGRDAVTRDTLNYWNEPRGIVKVGGANVPADVMPAHVTIENLHIRSARPPYEYTGRRGFKYYANDAAAIFVEKGEHITIRNCVLTDSGNGLFVAHGSSDVLVEGCEIRDNGMEDRIYEHNSYTEADGIVFQYNHFGPLRAGARGNNLKDRSAGTVIRYNWIEDGNRQLDLVDSGHEELLADPDYRKTYVYGNILVEGDREGNSQIVHYGGDSRDLRRYRKGMLYFHHNTVVSTRKDRTTLFRLSSLDESADVRNNIFHVTARGDSLAATNRAGNLRLVRNWLTAGWVPTHGALLGGVSNESNITGKQPGFVDIATGDFRLTASSACRDTAGALSPDAVGHPVTQEYRRHRDHAPRPADDRADLGAYEHQD